MEPLGPKPSAQRTIKIAANAIGKNNVIGLLLGENIVWVFIYASASVLNGVPI